MRRNGPPRLPTSMKVVRGTFRADQAAVNEPKPEPDVPQVPPHLSDEAKVEWGRVSQELFQLGLLSRIDRAALAAYCDCWSDYVDASEKVRTMGKVVTTKTVIGKDGVQSGGNVIENPFYSIKKRSLELMYRYLTEFGMTPASRSRIEANPKTAEQPASRWKGFGG